MTTHDHEQEYDAERHLPPHHTPLPALSPDTHRAIAEADYVAISDSPEFGELRRRFRSFAFPMTLAFLIWYFGYVLLSTYAIEFMSQRIGGSAITIGLVLGFGQFVTTFLITALYIRHANKSLDPIATHLKSALENAHGTQTGSDQDRATDSETGGTR
ncbi:DUF485 domain-containing protein [Granulicoccus phenolivorans]|uniref:DUF485 domain-containing protein n=1 Tax=Granulicoccus phenolivorans TaxID=266854 RepID=UPI0004140013|nr:DUF485 domain-containing protein [Granulicoccus phenolivorans]